MANEARADIREIVAAANAGHELRPVEIWRLMVAAGDRITSRGVRMAAESAEHKLRVGLVRELGASVIVECCDDA